MPVNKSGLVFGMHSRIKSWRFEYIDAVVYHVFLRHRAGSALRKDMRITSFLSNTALSCKLSPDGESRRINMFRQSDSKR